MQLILPLSNISSSCFYSCTAALTFLDITILSYAWELQNCPDRTLKDLAFPLSSTVQSRCNVRLSSCKNREIDCMEKSNEMSWWHMFMSWMLCPVITCFQTFESADWWSWYTWTTLQTFIFAHSFLCEMFRGFLACTGCSIKSTSPESVKKSIISFGCMLAFSHDCVYNSLLYCKQRDSIGRGTEIAVVTKTLSKSVLHLTSDTLKIGMSYK